MDAGVTCAITDPLKLTATVRSTDVLLGHDERGKRFLSHWRYLQKTANN